MDRARRIARVLGFLAAAVGAGGRPGFAHDLERTRVFVTFQRDGSFVVDVANDPGWLLLRLEPFAALTAAPATTPDARDRRLHELAPAFIDRIVFFVDGHEIRPTSAEYVPPGTAAADDRSSLATYRLRGRVKTGARGLRWFYGLVVDPYPLTVMKANGQAMTQWVGEAGWSAPIDLAGTFPAPPLQVAVESLGLGLAIGVFLLGIKWRSKSRASTADATE